MIQLDLIERIAELDAARARRDDGMAVAEESSAEWFKLALIQIGQFRRQYAIGDDFTFEEVIEALKPLIGKPPNKYCPGSLCMRAVRLKLIERTGSYRQSTSKIKNGHENKVYRWVPFA